MIPVWILTVLHYTALVTAVVVLVLIGWQHLGKQGSPQIEKERDEPAEKC